MASKYQAVKKKDSTTIVFNPLVDKDLTKSRREYFNLLILQLT